MKKLLMLMALSIFAAHAVANGEPVNIYGPVTVSISQTAQVPLTTTANYKEAFILQVSSVTGTAAVQVQESLDKVNWFNVELHNLGSASISLTATANGLYSGNTGGAPYLRINVPYVVSGSITSMIGWGTGNYSPHSQIAVTPVP